MATVQSMMTQLAQRVDPRAKDGTEFTTSNIGTVAGSIFSAQRLLDIYNHARIALLQSLLNTHDKAIVTLMVGGVVKSTTISWSSQAAAKPTDMIEFISMSNAAKTQMILLPATYLAESALGANPHLLSSATNLLIFDVGANFSFVGTATLVLNANTYVIRYIGLTNWVLTDVTAGTATETIEDTLHPVLLELAQAIATEMGSVELNALAAKLVGGK